MIQVSRPTFDDETKEALLDVLDTGWVGNGPKVKEFEEKFAEYVGAKYAIATNSCTTALHVALIANGITGGELIVPPMTFVSSAIIGRWCGMDVTFADVDPITLCLDPESLVITDDTKAIIAVHSHGRLADIAKIREKIGDRNILLIEDAAHAMYTPGVGTGDVTCYSFQAVKTMPTGDGGMITTNDEEMAKRIREWIWLGVIKSTWERLGDKKYAWDYNIQHGGIKAYMIDLIAVLGLGQLKRLEGMNARRREIQALYNEGLSTIPQIKIPEFSHTVQYYSPQVERRDELIEYLGQHGIASSVHFKPLSEMDEYKDCVKRPLPGCEVWKKIISLPVHNNLSDEQVYFIIDTIHDFYDNSPLAS